jgi:uncharacterized protein (UPF0332 family)
MSIDVSDLISLAKELAAGNSECEWRSGASRAYYAAYHKALIVADDCLPTSLYAIGVHQQLSDRFAAEGKKGKALAYKLLDLKRVRTLADYRLARPFSQNDATDAVKDTIAFMPLADAFLSRMKTDTPAPS